MPVDMHRKSVQIGFQRILVHASFKDDSSFFYIMDVLAGRMLPGSFAHGFVCNVPKLFCRLGGCKIRIRIKRPVSIGDDFRLFEESSLLVAVCQYEHGLFLLGQIQKCLMVELADLGIIGPDMGFRVYDHGIAFCHSGLHAMKKGFLLIQITAQRDHTVSLHAQTHTLQGKNMGMADDEAFFRKGGQGANVGITLHLRVVAHQKAAVLTCLLQNLPVGKTLMAIQLLQQIYHRDHDPVVKYKFEHFEEPAVVDVLEAFPQGLHLDVKP